MSHLNTNANELYERWYRYGAQRRYSTDAFLAAALSILMRLFSLMPNPASKRLVLENVKDAVRQMEAQLDPKEGA